MITDFRLNKNSKTQVKTNGKYGYKTTQTNKVFNPYVFFNNEDTVKIETYLRK